MNCTDAACATCKEPKIRLQEIPTASTASYPSTEQYIKRIFTTLSGHRFGK